MGEAIGTVFTAGVGVAISPLPIISVVLMLGTPRARSNGPAFLIGWLAGLLVVGTVVLILAGTADAGTSDGPALWASVLNGVLGILLVLLALRTWRRRPRGGTDPSLPAWLASLESFTTARAFGLGGLLSGGNPKNFMLTISAGTGIAQATDAVGAQAVALAVFALLGSLGVIVPVVAYFVGGSRAGAMLVEWKDWLVRNNTVILTVVLVLLGANHIGDAVSALTMS